MLYLDLHTHRRQLPPEAGLSAIRSFDLSESEPFDAWPYLRSVGLHPWYLPAHWPELLPLLEQRLQAPRTPLLGEAGLDALRGPDIRLQTEAFAAQARLARQLGKPIVIHCVRAFDALERLHRAPKNPTPWIIHGFNKGGNTAEKMIKAGFMLSFGAALLQADSPAARCFPLLPLERILLETDDAPTSIAAIYQRAAELRGLPVSVLADAIYANWQRLNLID
jgi:TatD DNase family protein